MVTEKEIKLFVDQIETQMFSQFEAMKELRLMHSDIRDIQEKHWIVLYLGNLCRMQKTIDAFKKEHNFS